jgi:hypothetical protein
MPTSCPIKQNPIHVEWAKERSRLREDVIFSRTKVKHNYIGNLFRPSRRYATKPLRKKIDRTKHRKLPKYGTMGSMEDDGASVARDDYAARHQLSSMHAGKKLLKKSPSTTFPKTKRLVHTIKPWGQSYQSLAMSCASLDTFKTTTSLASDKFFGTTARSFPIVPAAAVVHVVPSPQLEEKEQPGDLVVPTLDGIPQNNTFKNTTTDCKATFQSLVPRPCAKAFSVVAANIAKSFSIESSVRKKHRRYHQKKKLIKVRQVFAQRFSNLEAIEKSKVQHQEDAIPEGKTKDSWTRKFNVEGTYESPFLGTSHSTRNVTVLSPIKNKKTSTN